MSTRITRKRKPRKWRNVISVHDISEKHHRSKSDDEKDIFLGVLDDWVSSYTESILFREEYRKRYVIDWKCISCKTEIHIDSKNILHNKKPVSPKAFYCDKCRPKKMTIDRVADPILVRYMNSFYSNIRLLIQKNTNVLDLL